MKKIFLSLAAIVSIASCTPHTSNGVAPAIYNSWNDRDPISRVDNSVSPNKKGTACVTNIMSVYSSGDSSIETAKKEGGIQKVAFVDRTYTGFLGFYQKGCTVVRGN